MTPEKKRDSVTTSWPMTHGSGIFNENDACHNRPIAESERRPLWLHTAVASSVSKACGKKSQRVILTYMDIRHSCLRQWAGLGGETLSLSSTTCGILLSEHLSFLHASANESKLVGNVKG